MLGREQIAAILLLALASSLVHAQERRPTCPAPQAVADWIRDLDDNSFSVRQQASQQLLNAGRPAIEAVAAAARGNSLEVTERALHILDEASYSPDPLAARAAKEALQALAESKHASAGRAQRVLRSRVERSAHKLEQTGVDLTLSDEKIVGASFDSAVEVAANLRLLHELPDLERVSVATAQFDDAGAAELKGLPRVKYLNLFQSQIGDEGLKVLPTLPNLRSVPLGLTRVTDAGLAHLKELDRLEYLGLRGNDITDAGLAHLKNLTNLTGLYLGETKITDAGLVHLRGLTKLNLLRLDQTAVGDAGLEQLTELMDLRELNLSETRVTDAGVERLQSALPNVLIRRKTP